MHVYVHVDVDVHAYVHMHVYVHVHGLYLGENISVNGIVRGDELVQILLIKEIEVARLLNLHVHAHKGHNHPFHRLCVVVESNRLSHHRADDHDVVPVQMSNSINIRYRKVSFTFSSSIQLHMITQHFRAI